MAQTLFQRLGGMTAVTSAVDDFVARCANDSRINAKFARTNIPRLRSMLIDQLCEASGGPCRYSGRDMKTTHTGMRVTTAEFNALVEDLVATLNKFGVGKGEQDELLGVLAPMKSEIVEVDSAETGTPLPDSYQPAPELATAKG